MQKALGWVLGHLFLANMINWKTSKCARHNSKQHARSCHKHISVQISSTKIMEEEKQTKFSAFVSKYKVVERLKKLSAGSLFSNVPGLF